MASDRRPRDAADTLIDLRRRVSNLEKTNWSQTGHTFNPARTVNPVAEWLAYFSNIDTADYVPSQGAWALIDAELNASDDQARAFRAVRENLGIIPPMARSLTTWNKETDVPLDINDAGGLVGNFYSPPQPDKPLLVRDGMWCWPLRLPGRPSYRRAYTNISVGGGGLNPKGVAVALDYVMTGDGLDVISETGPAAPNDVSFEWHARNTWTPPGDTTPLAYDALEVKDAETSNPVNYWGYGRGAWQHYHGVDTDNDGFFDVYVLDAEGGEQQWSPPSFATVYPFRRAFFDLTFDYPDSPPVYYETATTFSAMGLYLLADEVRAWNGPLTLPQALRMGATFTGDLDDDLPMLPANTTGFTLPEYGDIAGFDLDGPINDQGLGDLVDGVLAGAAYDQQGWVSVLGDTATSGSMGRAWLLYRYGIAHLRGFIERSHISSSTPILDLPPEVLPPNNTSFACPALGSAAVQIGHVANFGSFGFISFEGMEVGDRAYLDGIMWAP